jgi:cytochrome c551/c552
MIPCKPISQRLTLLALLFCVFSALNIVSAQDGKALFMSKCASCHALDKDLAGPKLRGILDAEPYGGDLAKISHWVRNVNKLVVTDKHYQDLKTKFGGSVMTEF